MNQNPNFDFYSFNVAEGEQKQTAAHQEPEAAPSATQAPTATFAPPVRPDEQKLRRARRAYSRAGWALAVMIVVWYAASMVLQMLAVLFAPASLETTWFSFLSGSVPLYVFGVPSLALVLIGLPREAPQKQRFGAGRFTVAFFIIFTLAIAGNIVGNTLMTVLGNVTGFEFSNMLEQTMDMPLPLTVLAMVVLAPVFEELIFRKLLMDRLLPYGELAAIILTALMFGLIHGNFYQFFYAAAMGTLLAYVYVRSGKLWLSMLMHALFNLFGGVLPSLLTKQFNLNEFLTITDEVEMVTFIFDHFNDFMLLGIFYMLFYSFAIVGAVLLIVFWKRLKLETRSDEIPRGWRASVMFGNAGVIVAIVLCAGLFLLNMIAVAVPLG